jgi:hypothetical protein
VWIFSLNVNLFAGIYDYQGDLVVLTRPVCEYAGESDTSNFCLYCKKLFRRVVIHIKNVHADVPRVSSISKLTNASEMAAAFEQLLREGNFFINNARAMATQKGFVIPTRRSPHFREHTSLVHCTRCFMLMEKHNFNRHVDRCAMREATVDDEDTRPSLWEEKQLQFTT